MSAYHCVKVQRNNRGSIFSEKTKHLNVRRARVKVRFTHFNGFSCHSHDERLPSAFAFRNDSPHDYYSGEPNPLVMKKRTIRILEITTHILVVLFFIRIGYNNYLLFDAFQDGYKAVGFTISTNVYTGPITAFVFSLYIIYWFVLYIGVFSRENINMGRKFVYAIFAALVMTCIHSGGSYLLVEYLQSTGLLAGEMIGFQFNWDPTQAAYTWYLMLTLITFAFWSAFEFFYRYEELLNADKAQTELSLIRSQLRPHFFFNTLKNLYSMALESENERLAGGIENLTEMMRYSLHQSTEEFVSLSDEWEYIEQYVDLQKLRIKHENVTITLRSSGDLSSVKIAPMILINFVENAFKHGISYENPSSVNISLVADSETITLAVKNSNYPSKQDTGRSGIGTEQTKRLLSLHYQDQYDLEITSGSENHLIVLTLPSR
jgi:hypothetical protein